MLYYAIKLEFNGRLLIFILKVVCWKVSILLKRGQFHNSKPYTLHSLRKCEIIYSRENYPKLLLPNCKLGTANVSKEMLSNGFQKNERIVIIPENVQNLDQSDGSIPYDIQV